MSSHQFRGDARQAADHCKEGLQALYRVKGIEPNPKRSVGCLVSLVMLSMGLILIGATLGHPSGSYETGDLVFAVVLIVLAFVLLYFIKEPPPPEILPDGTRFRMWEIFFDEVVKKFPEATFEFSPWEADASGALGQMNFELMLRTETLGKETTSFTGFHDEYQVDGRDYQDRLPGVGEITGKRTSWKTTTSTMTHRRHRINFVFDSPAGWSEASGARPSEFARVDSVEERDGKVHVAVVLKGWMNNVLGHDREGQPRAIDLNIKSVFDLCHHPDFIGENMATAFVWLLERRPTA
jgi:hypothetical protein